MKNYSFDDIVKSKMAGHEAPVPADAWNNIKGKRKKRRPSLFWWITSAVLIAGWITAIVYTRNNNGNENDQLQANGPGKKQEVLQAENIMKKNDTAAGITPADVSLVAAGNEKQASSPVPGEDVAGTQHAMTVNTTTKLLSGLASTSDSANNRVTVHHDAKAKHAKHGTNRLFDSKENDQAMAVKQDLAGVKKRKRTGAGKTKMTISQSDAEIAVVDTNDEVAGEKKTSVAVDPLSFVKQVPATNTLAIAEKKTPRIESVTDTAIANQAAKKSRPKKNIFVDLGATGFIAVQQNARLLSIARTTIMPTQRSEFIADQIRTSVEPAFSYTIALRKSISGKFDMAAGLQYVKLKETIRLAGKERNTHYDVVKRLDATGSFLYDDTVSSVTNGIRVINAVNSYDIVSIPVGIQYYFWKKSGWAVSLAAGLNFTVSNMYKNSIEGELQPVYASGSAGKPDRKFAADIFTGIRLSRQFGRHYQLFAEPSLQFNLMRYRLPGMIDYKNIHRAGITFGFSYQLNY